MKDPVLIKTVERQYEADIINGFLHANGVEAFVIVHNESGSYPYPMTLPTGIKIYVHAKDAKIASKLLKQIK